MRSLKWILNLSWWLSFSTQIIHDYTVTFSLCFSVVLRFSKMKTVTNLYILNLAIADEFFLVGVPILIYTMHHLEWIFGVYFCKLYMISTSITQFTSSIFLVIMSADRFEQERKTFIIWWWWNWIPNDYSFLMKLQIYSSVPSYWCCTVQNTARFKNRFDYCMVLVGYTYAPHHSILDDGY
jgi:hypothetical protein